MERRLFQELYLGARSLFFKPGGGVGGSKDSAYCYSVYLRHLVRGAASGLGASPEVVVELGPGESLGVGIAAVLTGTRRYYACDAAAHRSNSNDLKVFDGLCDMLHKRAPIPHGGEFQEIEPMLDDYTFPDAILNPERLVRALDPGRLDRIRRAIAMETNTMPQSDVAIAYHAPWSETWDQIQENSVDMVLSQAVLEHVDELEQVYAACYRWLRPGGFMSHQIDLRCHELAREWNGHWKYGNITWALIRGRRPYLINRVACSEHLRLIRRVGFEVVLAETKGLSGGIPRPGLARRFRHLSDDDLLTACLFVQARKSTR